MPTTVDGVDEKVERETVLDVDAERAWEAISDPAELERWLADEAEIEAVEGAPVRFEIDGEQRTGRVERVVEGRELAFTWSREPGEESLVELELTPLISGGTRISVAETRTAGGGPLLMAAGSQGSWEKSLMRLLDLARLALA